MRKFLLLFTAVAVLLLGATPLRAHLEVYGFKVTFLPGQKVHVRGKMIATGLSPAGVSGISNQLEVSMDLLHSPKEAFLPLISGYIGRSIRSGRVSRPIHQGQPFKVPGFSHLGQNGVYNRYLDDRRDEGREIAFDGIMDLSHLKIGPDTRYRIVAVHDHQSVMVLSQAITGAIGKFRADYSWCVYGPFPWGQAPAFVGKLKTGPRIFMSRFDKGGAPPVQERRKEVLPEEEPDSEDAAGTGASSGGGRIARAPVPPSPRDMAAAGRTLREELRQISARDDLSVGVKEKMVLISCSLPAAAGGRGLTDILARMLVAAARKAAWVETLVMEMWDDAGSYEVETSWDSAARFGRGEIDLREFRAAWKTNLK
ncbi:MAG: hypothetical protein JXO51_05820 [Candidatus Aminicenantes bacterium]|nr:hypothetical protein [Candidatus Aminicenantes bacterium]